MERDGGASRMRSLNEGQVLERVVAKYARGNRGERKEQRKGKREEKRKRLGKGLGLGDGTYGE
jgi:hypothetical protein